MSSGLVPIFSWKTRKNSTNGSMENKKFAKKNFCHTPSAHIFIIYSILLFKLHMCNISLDSYKNKVITSVEFNTMKRTYEKLLEISFSEAEVRCVMVMVMALVHNKGEVDNRTIANNLGVNMRTIQRICKKLE